MRGLVEHFARLIADVLGASGSVIASVASPGGYGVRIEVVESLPSGLGRRHPGLLTLLEEVARRNELLVLDGGAISDQAGTGTELKAFAGIPLYGDRGELLGVLAAVDSTERSWSGRNLQNLRDLATACAAEVSLRTSEAGAHDARRGAEQAQHEAEEATGRARAGQAELQGRLGRFELLLRAAEMLADTSGLEEVRHTVGELVSGDLKPAFVGLTLREDQGALYRAVDTAVGPVPLEAAVPFYNLRDAWPSAQAARENRVVDVPDRQALVDGYDPQTVSVFDAMGLRSAVCVPLPGTQQPTLGALVVAWDEPHEVNLQERAVLTMIAGYTAMAVERALHLDSRISVARQLQRAMLTELPTVPGLELAALYRPAAQGEMVGGDWYDAYRLPEAAGKHGRSLAFTVGDVTGHSMHAATLMGQARSMLRQADMDRSGSPASAVTSLEYANMQLDTGISGTLVHAHLMPQADGRWQLRWTNAGHPAPLLARPNRDIEYLAEHDRLMFPGLMPPDGRTVHERVLLPGDVLLLHTDGLVEHRSRDVEQGTALAALHLKAIADWGGEVEPLLRTLADTLAGDDHCDDVVLFALRVT